jgi:hypothetical protein
MDEAGNLNHTKWECKYHVVFIPKWRRKVLYGELRRYLGEVFRAETVAFKASKLRSPGENLVRAAQILTHSQAKC